MPYYEFLVAKNELKSDYKIAERLQKGDLEAFDDVFNRYSSRLFGFAVRFLKSKEETEGLVQDVFLKVWENRKELKKEYSLKSYLFTIAYHNICKIFRKKRIYLELTESNGNSKNRSFSLEEQIDYKFILEQVNRLIELLPEKQKTIFIKSRKEGKSTREIAKEMKLAPGTIDNHISAALKFLRKHISDTNLALLLFFAIFIQ